MKSEGGFVPEGNKKNEIKKEELTGLETLTRYFLVAFPLSKITEDVRKEIFKINQKDDKSEKKEKSVERLAVIYVGFIRKVHEVIYKVYFDITVDAKKVSDFINDLKNEFDLLSKELSSTKEDQKYLEDLFEHTHDLISQAAFDKAAYKKTFKTDFDVAAPVVPFLVLGEKGWRDFVNGAEALTVMQHQTEHIVVGQQDIAVEFPGSLGLFRLEPGGVVRVKATIPRDYFQEKFPNFNPAQHAAAAVEALIRNQVAALAWLKKPVERSTLGQLGGELRVPTLDPGLVQINSDGSVTIEMVLFNRNATRPLVFDGQVEQPMFRLFVDPSRGLLTGENLLVAARAVVGENFDPRQNLVKQQGQAIALRLPVTEYAIREDSHEEINVSELLTGRDLVHQRPSVDSLLGITGWSGKSGDIYCPPCISMVLGQTPKVTFPSGVTGVISQRMLVEHSGRRSFFARHGGSRVIDPFFSQPVRTEFVVKADRNKIIGQQFLIIHLYQSAENM